MKGLGFLIIPLFTTILVGLVLLFKVWLFGSLITSGVKSVAGSCGQTYDIEKVIINGNWFCPTIVKK